MAIIERHRMGQRPAAGRLINVTIALSLVRPLRETVRWRLAALSTAVGDSWQTFLLWSLLPLAGWLTSDFRVINGGHLLAVILLAAWIVLLQRRGGLE